MINLRGVLCDVLEEWHNQFVQIFFLLFDMELTDYAVYWASRKKNFVAISNAVKYCVPMNGLQMRKVSTFRPQEDRCRAELLSMTYPN